MRRPKSSCSRTGSPNSNNSSPASNTSYPTSAATTSPWSTRTKSSNWSKTPSLSAYRTPKTPTESSNNETSNRSKSCGENSKKRSWTGSDVWIRRSRPKIGSCKIWTGCIETSYKKLRISGCNKRCSRTKNWRIWRRLLRNKPLDSMGSSPKSSNRSATWLILLISRRKEPSPLRKGIKIRLITCRIKNPGSRNNC